MSALSVLAVLLALVFGSWKSIFFATLVSSILSQFSQPSGMKLFKMHVPEAQMQLGMSMYQSMMAIFMILGPLMGTFVYFRFGINTAVAIMGVCFLISAAVLMFLPPDRELERKEETRLRTEMALGFRYVLSNKLLVSLGGCFLAAGLALGLISPLGIFLVTENLGLTKENLQWFTAANGIAMILGGGLAIGLGKKMSPQAMLIFGMLLGTITMALMGMTKIVWVALAAQFFFGLGMPAIQIGINTMILNNTVESFVGRVNGILNPLFMGAMVLTMSIAGLMKAAMPLSTIYLISAVLLVVGVLIMLPRLRTRAQIANESQGSA